jgi:hypothetical protein
MAWCLIFLNSESFARAENITFVHSSSDPRNLWIRRRSNVQLQTGTSSIGNWLGFNLRRKFMHGLRERKRLPPKTCWITYGLQGLSTEKFLEVVQKILDGKYILLKPPEIESQILEPDEECFLTEN